MIFRYAFGASVFGVTIFRANDSPTQSNSRFGRLIFYLLALAVLTVVFDDLLFYWLSVLRADIENFRQAKESFSFKNIC